MRNLSETLSDITKGLLIIGAILSVQHCIYSCKEKPIDKPFPQPCKKSFSESLNGKDFQKMPER